MDEGWKWVRICDSQTWRSEKGTTIKVAFMNRVFGSIEAGA
jgi:hypothetical protein